MDLQYSVETAVEVEVVDRVWLFALKSGQTTRSWVAALLSRGKHVVWSSGQSCTVTPGTGWGVGLLLTQRQRCQEHFGQHIWSHFNASCSETALPQCAYVLDVIQSQSNVRWLQAVKAVTALPVKWKVCIMHMVSVTSVLFIKGILVLYSSVLSRPGRTYTLNCDPEVYYIFQKVWCNLQLHGVLKYFTIGSQYQ